MQENKPYVILSRQMYNDLLDFFGEQKLKYVSKIVSDLIKDTNLNNTLLSVITNDELEPVNASVIEETQE